MVEKSELDAIFAKSEKRHQKYAEVLAEDFKNLNNQLRDDRKAKLQKEREEAIRKATAPFDAIEHQKQLDEAFASLLSED